MRLDLYLTDKGLTKSRSKAVECIKAGLVSVNGVTDVKPSLTVSDTDEVVLLGKPYEYVGRGGLKLEHALDFFEIDVADMTAVDIGASTGGFTDCLLRRGAKHVFAIDSGHDQLDPSLRTDSRVSSIEGFNARGLTPDTVGGLLDIAVSDVSFISQTLILEPAYSVLKDGGIYIGLIKPQFECGTAALNKNGIVKGKKQHKHAIDRVISAGLKLGFAVKGITKSPVTGGDGNTEFLVYMKKSAEPSNDISDLINEVCL